MQFMCFCVFVGSRFFSGEFWGRIWILEGMLFLLNLMDPLATAIQWALCPLHLPLSVVFGWLYCPTSLDPLRVTHTVYPLAEIPA